MVMVWAVALLTSCGIATTAVICMSFTAARMPVIAMYFNQRTEVWGWMRDWLKAGAEIPDDPELAVDLCSPGYDTARGRSDGRMACIRLCQSGY